MKAPRLARSLAAAVLAVGLLIGVTSPANAAYPPNRVGYFTAVFPITCVYNDDGTFSSAGKFSFNYVVEVPEADFMVTREDGEVIHVETVEMGIHTYDYEPVGLEVFQSFSAELTGQTDSGWDVAGATIAGCPLPDTGGVLDGGTDQAASGAKAATPAATTAKPVTGSAPWLVGALALALFAGGAVMLVVSRRRPATG